MNPERARKKTSGGKGPGAEYWSRRPGPSTPGRSSKQVTHRKERLASKRLVGRLQDEIEQDLYDEIRLNKVLDERLSEPWDDFYRPFDYPIDDLPEPWDDPFTYHDPSLSEDEDDFDLDTDWFYNHDTWNYDSLYSW